jgi:hypothetical protein
MKLTNVARTSLEELRRDYEDFLRQRGLPLWPRDDPRRQLQGAGLWLVILTALNMDALVAL